MCGAAVYAWRHRTAPGARALVFGMLAAGWWSLTYAIALSTRDLSGRISWAKAQHIGVAGLPVALLVFFIHYTGHSRWLTRRRLVLIAAVPTIGVLLAWTNEAHGLIWANVRLVLTDSASLLDLTYGRYFWLYAAYNYIEMGACVFLLLQALVRSYQLLYRQALIMLAGMLLAWAVNLLYLAGWNPIPNLDLTPFGFCLAGLALAWGVFRYRLLDIVPIAREQVIDSLHDAVIALDAQHRLVDLNPVAQHLLGLSRPLPVGLPAAQLLRDWPEVLDLCCTPGAHHVETRLGAGEAAAYHEWRSSPLADRRGQTLGWTLVVHDVTASRQAQARMLDQQRALATLEERERIGRDLHDGLGQVMGYVNVQAQAAEALLESGQIGPAAEALRQITQVARGAHDEIRDYILGMRTARQVPHDYGGSEPAPNFAPALRAYLQRVEASYGLRVQLDLPPELDPALATVAAPSPSGEPDRPQSAGIASPLSPDAEAQLLFIVKEALANVRRHAGVDVARVTVALAAGHAEVVIADEGRGFEPPAAGDRPSASASLAATALPASPHLSVPDMHGHFGLEIMRERAEAAGGNLEVHSAPGQGTRVMARLPLAAAPLLSASGRALRALLIDDHPLFLDGLRTMLTADGFQVVGLGRDGLDAQELARHLRPDLILMDVQMPRCDGLEATRRIKADLPDCKIVMLTVAAEEESLYRALEVGASGYLLKSLERPTFLQMLHEIAAGQVTLTPEMAARVLAAFQSEAAGQPAAPSPPAARAGEAVLNLRQRQVLELVARGLLYKEVAAALHLTVPTVKYHMGQILEQLQLKSRGQAIAYARKKGMVE